MSAMTAAAPVETKTPRPLKARSPVRPQHATQKRPQEHPEQYRKALVRLGVEARRALHRKARQRRVENQARVGRVVVGDEDDRALGARVTHLAHDVVGGARRQEAPAKPEPPSADVVVDGRCGDRAADGAQDAPARCRGGHRGGVQEAERPPVAAVRALGLHAHLAGAGPLQLARQPPGRAAFAGAGGGPLVRRRARGRPAR